MSSCARTDLELPIKVKKYERERVSTKAALDLALSAYVKGCMDKANELGAKKGSSYLGCVAKAKIHLKDNILFILESK